MFLLDEMTQQNASKFVIFYIYENLKLLFPFFISCYFSFCRHRHKVSSSLRILHLSADIFICGYFYLWIFLSADIFTPIRGYFYLWIFLSVDIIFCGYFCNKIKNLKIECNISALKAYSILSNNFITYI